MKTKYSTSRTLALLLGYALFLTSCTKEVLPGVKELKLQEVKANNALELQSQEAIVNSVITVKAGKTWMDCGGWSVNLTPGITYFAVHYRIVTGKTTEPVRMELYRAGDSLNTCSCLYLLATPGCYAIGDKDAYFNIWPRPNWRYFIRMRCGNAEAWVPKMEFGSTYKMAMTGTSVTLAIDLY